MIRIYQLAKEIGVPSKELVEMLKELGVEVKTHMSSVDDETVATLKELLAGRDGEALPAQEEPEPAGQEAPLAVQQEASFVEPGAPEKAEAPAEAPAAAAEAPLSEEAPARPPAAPKRRCVKLGEVVVVRDLAALLEISSSQIIRELMGMGLMVTINQSVGFDTARSLLEKHGLAAELEEAKSDDPRRRLDLGEAKDQVARPPVVSVMGHVDHGKTKLLDAIRKTKVAEREQGGITQHIGASTVVKDGRKIVFLDTPGHEAFTTLRARGAQVTDLVVLVVAADDGVMPQTVEAANHAKAAGVPLLVALNKMDKPQANPDRVMRQLADLGLTPEAWGGDSVVVPVSAVEKTGLDDLLEMILLQADLLELKTVLKGAAVGTVIESKMQKGRGIVCTCLLQRGTLKIGDIVRAGAAYGRVRNMWDDRGETLKEATPETPIELLGFQSLPEAGDALMVAASEREARELVQKAREQKEKEALKRKMALEQVHQKLETGEIKEIPVICKGDTQGSIEGLAHALMGLGRDEVQVKILHSGVGDITETDCLLASASSAVVIGFGVKCPGQVRKAAEEKGVEVRCYDVIYKAVEDLQLAIEGMLAPRYEEVLLGKAEVRAIFTAPKLGKVAGCMVVEGLLQRGARARVLRDGEVLCEGTLDSLRRFKENVKEVPQGQECGVGMVDFKEFTAGDVLEVYELRKV